MGRHRSVEVNSLAAPGPPLLGFSEIPVDINVMSYPNWTGHNAPSRATGRRTDRHRLPDRTAPSRRRTNAFQGKTRVGQLSRLRIYAEAAEANARRAARFTSAVLALKIVRTMNLITILNHCHRHRGFAYQHARFAADQQSIDVDVRPRVGRRKSVRGATSRHRAMITFPRSASSSYLCGAFWCSCCIGCGASSAATVAWSSRRAQVLVLAGFAAASAA